MKLSTVARVIHATLKGEDVEFEEVSIDTRRLQRGALYVAIRGDQFDGHDFIEDASQKHAVAAVVSQPVSTDLPILTVTDTRQALGEIAAFHRQQLDPIVIGVTGSCGKTTTRAFLESVFSQAGATLASRASFNNDIGVPLTLLNLTPEHRFAVCEMGANHPGEIATLTHWVKPDVAIITNAAAAHLDGFGDIKGVACAKSEIFQGLDTDGTAVINADDDYADFWKRQVGERRIVTFGVEKTADVMALEVTTNAQAQPQFELVLPTGRAKVVLQLMGEHNVMNALAAAAAAYALGLSVEVIVAGLEATQPESKRLVEKTGYAGAVIIDDTYNANPLSMRAAIAVLAKRPGDSVLVLGDMLELGDRADAFHRELGEQAGQQGIHRLYSYGQHSRHAAEAFGENAFHFDDREALIKSLRDYLHKEVTVLIKGSNSMGMDQVAKALMEV